MNISYFNKKKYKTSILYIAILIINIYIYILLINNNLKKK